VSLIAYVCSAVEQGSESGGCNGKGIVRGKERATFNRYMKIDKSNYTQARYAQTAPSSRVEVWPKNIRYTTSQ
jgi:hypothetical protein